MQGREVSLVLPAHQEPGHGAAPLPAGIWPRSRCQP